MSAALHAAVCLCLVVLALIAPPPKVIAPDRIKIIEIDLKDVKIAGLETKLRNIDIAKTDFPEPKKPEPPKPDPKPEPKPLPEPPKIKPAPEKPKVPPKPAPEVKTIKVNREVQAIDRTLTVSVIDALRIAMTRCWHIDNTRADLAEIRAVAHLKLFPNGRVQSLWFEEQSLAETDPTWAYVFDTIQRAVDVCQPFSMLPRGEYENWKSVQFTFFPSAKRVE